jgi:hypothetical protein
MTKITQRTNPTIAAIDAHHEAITEPPRPHMGVSLLGHVCDRYLWLNFRWALGVKKPGRVLRLFRRGHLEEPTIIKDLMAVGFVFRPSSDGQHRVDFGGHVSGSMDGIIESGVHEAPKKPHVAEFKTHSKKSFDELEKNGIEKSKPMHYVQCQVYMLGAGIDRAFYMAVCKDDDRLYVERIRFDKVLAEKAVARGKRLALADEMPPPLSTDPTWYQCKQCDAYEYCHQGLGVASKNCRVCAWSTAKDDGTWRCEKFERDGIPLGFQRTGCDSWELHDDLLPF